MVLMVDDSIIIVNYVTESWLNDGCHKDVRLMSKISKSNTRSGEY